MIVIICVTTTTSNNNVAAKLILLFLAWRAETKQIHIVVGRRRRQYKQRREGRH